jgi:hypothetical protein
MWQDSGMSAVELRREKKAVDKLPASRLESLADYGAPCGFSNYHSAAIVLTAE